MKTNNDLNVGRNRHKGGFTLIELLVVIAILGLLAVLVAPAALRQLGGAKQKIAREQIDGLNNILDLYRLDVGSYPSADAGLQALVTEPPGTTNWHGPYVKGEKMPDDPWGHPFLYRFPSVRTGHDYDLCSSGEAGQATTPDAKGAICN